MGEANDASHAQPSVNEAWVIASTDTELAHGRKAQLAVLARSAASSMESCRKEMILRRKERLQVETMLRNEAEHRRTESERRQQRELDDWFAVTLRRRR